MKLWILLHEFLKETEIFSLENNKEKKRIISHYTWSLSSQSIPSQINHIVVPLSQVSAKLHSQQVVKYNCTSLPSKPWYAFWAPFLSSNLKKSSDPLAPRPPPTLTVYWPFLILTGGDRTAPNSKTAGTPKSCGACRTRSGAPLRPSLRLSPERTAQISSQFKSLPIPSPNQEIISTAKNGDKSKTPLLLLKSGALSQSQQ